MSPGSDADRYRGRMSDDETSGPPGDVRCLVVVTVVRNAPEDLERTCLSLEPFAGRFTHVIVDGASTDDTLSIAARWAEDLGSTVISRPDDGPYDAMNTALGMIDPHHYVWFMNAGDRVAGPGAFETVEAWVAQPTSPWCYGAVRRIALFDGDIDVGITHQGRFSTLRYAYGRIHLCHQSVIVRAGDLQALGGFDTRFPVYADFHAHLKLARRSPPATLRPVLSHSFGGGISGRHPYRNVFEQGRARRDALGLGPARSALDHLFTLKSVATLSLWRSVGRWRS